MRIGQVASAAGVGVETVRYYERKGLITQPPRFSRGVRRYPPETVQCIRFIRKAQTLGFSLKEIVELLQLRTDGSADCADIQRRARIKRDEVDAKIGHLQHIRQALDELITTCPGQGTLGSCSIIEALESRTDDQEEPS